MESPLLVALSTATASMALAMDDPSAAAARRSGVNRAGVNAGGINRHPGAVNRAGLEYNRGYRCGFYYGPVCNPWTDRLCQ